MPSPNKTGRRFPPPWTVEEQAACFVVRDANGQQLGYFYLEEEPGRRSAAKLLARTHRRQFRQAAGIVAEGLIGVCQLPHG